MTVRVRQFKLEAQREEVPLLRGEGHDLLPDLSTMAGMFTMSWN